LLFGKRVLINELEMISDALDSLDEYDRQLAIGYIEQGDEDSIHNLLGFLKKCIVKATIRSITEVNVRYERLASVVQFI
jgi:hypothetical protein